MRSMRLCTSCTRPAVRGQSRCVTCRASMRDSNAARYAEKREARQCQICSAGIKGRTVFCRPCRLRAASLARAARLAAHPEKDTATGRCSTCGRPGHNATLCQPGRPRVTEAATGELQRGRVLGTALYALIMLRRGRWTVHELAAELQVHWRTAYRLIRSLELAGVVVEVDAEHHYRVPAEPLRVLLGL